MKVEKMTCPSCGANLDVKDKMAFCQYCGATLAIDDENRTITHNYNRTFVTRDEARIRESERKENIRIKELEYKERKEKRDNKISIISGICGFGIPLLMILALLLGPGIKKWTAQAQGKISAGDHDDYIGEKYEAVIEQLEEMGFTNIVTVNLKDSGLAFWNDGKVKSVSIDGNDSFESVNYFHPDDKVIVKYH